MSKMTAKYVFTNAISFEYAFFDTTDHRHIGDLLAKVMGVISVIRDKGKDIDFHWLEPPQNRNLPAVLFVSCHSVIYGRRHGISYC
jgi:hypothetical protein